MKRSNIVKCVDNRTKREIYSKYKNKEEKTKTKLAKRYGISTRTLNRILEELDTKGGNDACESMKKLSNAMVEFGKALQNIPVYDYTVTKNQITVIRDGENRSVVKGYPRFNEIKRILVTSDFSEESLAECWELLNLPKYIAKFTEGELTVDHEQGRVWYGTFEIKNSLSDQLIKMLNEGKDVKGFVKFMEKLLENPDKHIVEQLYPFMQHNDITINEEGNIVGYRAVRGDFLDYASGTMDNSVGNTLKMPRNLVDCDPEVTCSTGLHIGAFSYVQDFGREGGRVLRVTVNPRNVCSVPVDYNGSKMRACEFTVIEDITGR